jgi:phospholipid/cholesterol/gamma-HCH transport system ATP-binding protein
MNQNVASADAPVIRMEGVAVGSIQDLNTIVAEQIDWTVDVGDFWVVAGLQGSGKSDLLMLTASLMGPQQGRYCLFGEEMPIFDEARLPLRLRVGIVFDGGQLFNHLTVRENVGLAHRYHHNLTAVQAASEVQRMLEAMELAPWADSTPGALGRNWQKRVGLARALMLRPELLLVDNPLAGLDPLHAVWWLNMLSQLVQGHPLMDVRPMTLVVTTADLRPWKGRAAHFAILRDKRFLVIGQREQLEAANQELLQDLLPAQ